MTQPDKISEKWPWNREFLRLFLIVPSAIGITAALSTYPAAGPDALWFLFGIPIGGLLYVIYGSVNRRVETLKTKYANAEGDMAEALIVAGKVQSPGIVILNGTDLELVPIVGEKHRIVEASRELIGEGQWLPGKYVWGKRVFTFRTAIFNPLAFAVAKSVGARWSPIIGTGR